MRRLDWGGAKATVHEMKYNFTNSDMTCYLKQGPMSGKAVKCSLRPCKAWKIFAVTEHLQGCCSCGATVVVCCRPLGSGSDSCQRLFTSLRPISAVLKESNTLAKLLLLTAPSLRLIC